MVKLSGKRDDQTRKDQTQGQSRLWACVGLLAASLVTLAPAALASTAGSGPRTVAAVFPPWWSAAHVARAAANSAQILRLGGLPSIIIVRTDRPDRLRADGAWLFLNPILGGCAPLTES
jgi:hypothetical protein